MMIEYVFTIPLPTQMQNAHGRPRNKELQPNDRKPWTLILAVNLCVCFSHEFRLFAKHKLQYYFLPWILNYKKCTQSKKNSLPEFRDKKCVGLWISGANYLNVSNANAGIEQLVNDSVHGKRCFSTDNKISYHD